MESSTIASVHPLLAFILALGLKEEDLMEAGKKRTKGFSLDKVTRVREPNAKEISELSLDPKNTRVFAYGNSNWILRAVPYNSLKKGSGLALQFTDRKKLKAADISGMTGMDSSHEDDEPMGPELEPGTPLDRTRDFESRPHFKERGISKPRREK